MLLKPVERSAGFYFFADERKYNSDKGGAFPKFNGKANYISLNITMGSAG